MVDGLDVGEDRVALMKLNATVIQRLSKSSNLSTLSTLEKRE